MRIHGNVFVLGRLGGTLAIDERPLVEHLVEYLQGQPIGVRVDDAIVVGKVTHTEAVDAAPNQRACSITIEVDDEEIRRVSPALLDASAQLSETVE